MATVGVGAALLLVVCVILRPAERDAAPSARNKAGPPEGRGPDGAPILTEVDGPRGEEAARPAPPSSSGEPPEESDEGPAQATGDPFWDDVASLLAARLASDPAEHRRAVLARTATYLGLEGSARATFSETASSVADEIDRAWDVREHLVLTLPPGGEQEEQMIQEAYEGSKRQALGRLEILLRDSADHQEFRARLEEWVDAVR